MTSAASATPRKKPALALIGAGSMGGALLRSWIASGGAESALDPARSAVFDPSITNDMKTVAADAGLSVNPPVSGLRFDIGSLAVKPQVADDVLPAYAPALHGAVVVSVMAGKACAAIRKSLPDAKIVRAMPNLPALIGAGASGIYADDLLSEETRATIETLMAASGLALWVDSEEAIDWVTAVSGSGPAYFFLLAEAMAAAGERLGLPAETANALARQTLIGAGALVRADERTVADLRRAVTSPGGTTAAALAVFDGVDGRLRALTEEAVRAAADRASALRG